MSYMDVELARRIQMTTKTLPIAVTLCVFLLGSCNRTEERTVTRPKMTSSEIETSVKAKLNADPALKDVSFSADAEKNEATLSGKVATEADRTRAVRFVKSVNDGLLVTDKIDVKPTEIARSDYNETMARDARERAKGQGEKIGDNVDDAWIHTKIAMKFMGDKDTPARKINIDVVNGVVTLRGRVDTAAGKTEAERIAKETDGVKRVTNRLTVGS